jgi:hypothetical protein
LGQKWTKEKARAWESEQGWIVGCNYIPSRCINNIEIWQEYEFDDVMRTVKLELDLAAGIGMNSFRMVLPFFVWRHQRDGLISRMNQFLDEANKRGIKLMPILFDDCCLPKTLKREPKFGKQPDPIPGHHGGTIVTSFDGGSKIGYNLCDDKENWPELEKYVRDLVTQFGQDERVVVWDIWNEPGNSNRDGMSQEFMERVFEVVRSENPIQPLTAGPWSFGSEYDKSDQNVSSIKEIEKRAMDLSDVISYHCYANIDISRKLIKELKKEGRPLLITEWLHRPFGNHVSDHLPLFKKENVGCYNWGLVAGKTQTYEPWDSIRKIPRIDLKLWQHDLFLEDFTPYNKEEINLFKNLT